MYHNVKELTKLMDVNQTIVLNKNFNLEISEKRMFFCVYKLIKLIYLLCAMFLEPFYWPPNFDTSTKEVVFWPCLLVCD